MTSITPSHVLEYLYCPRFIYFMEVLGIAQNEDTRYKVQEGREVHKYKALTNSDYKRKKLGVTGKEVEQELSAKRCPIHGIVDELLFLDDGTAAPLDYKFALYKDKVYNTYRMQAAMYAIMIEDSYNLPVKRAFLVYTRSKNMIVELEMTAGDYKKVEQTVSAIIEIIGRNIYPAGTKAKRKCADCCYRNICVG